MSVTGNRQTEALQSKTLVFANREFRSKYRPRSVLRTFYRYRLLQLFSERHAFGCHFVPLRGFRVLNGCFLFEETRHQSVRQPASDFWRQDDQQKNPQHRYENRQRVQQYLHNVEIAGSRDCQQIGSLAVPRAMAMMCRGPMQILPANNH